MIILVYVTTEWDYDLKTEVFVVRGDKGYVHTTDTLLKEVGERNSSIIEYYTATFNVDVLRDIQNSKVVIYDNDEAIPVYIDDDKVEMIDWQQGGQSETFTVRLGYGVEHKIYAKYLGNNKGLSSKSQIITLFEPLPDKYGTLIERTTDTTQYYANSSIQIPIRFTTNDTLESSETKRISVYADGVFKSSSNITLSAGQTTATKTLILPNGFDVGLHQVEVRFDGDEHNEAYSLLFNVSIGYNVEIIEHSPVISVTPTPIVDYNVVKCKVTDFFDNPIADAEVRLHETDTDTFYVQTTTDNEGIGTFNSITTLPASFYAAYQSHNSESLSLPVIRVTGFKLGAEKVIATGYSANAQVTIQSYEWVHNSKNNLEGIPVLFEDNFDRATKHYTNGEGVAVISYVGSNRGNITLNAKVGSALTQYAYVEDVTQYYSTETGIINKNYSVLYPNFYELYSAFKFEVRAANNASLIGFGNGETYTGSWSVSFVVVSATPNIRLMAGSWYNATNETMENTLLSNLVSLKGGQTVTITYNAVQNDEGTLTIQTPNDSSSYSCISKGNPFFGIISDTAKAQLSIDKIKFRKVE